MVHQARIELRTSGHGHIHQLDDEMARIVAHSGVETGIAHAFNIGSTAAIVMLELEPGLEADLPAILNQLIPPGRHYGHELAWHDGNAHSHLQASILGPDISIPVVEGRLVLGTWQQVVHLECDNKARDRSIVVTVHGE
jgi:secondary thiamine-phosphate synthase enzyme